MPAGRTGSGGGVYGTQSAVGAAETADSLPIDGRPAAGSTPAGGASASVGGSGVAAGSTPAGGASASVGASGASAGASGASARTSHAFGRRMRRFAGAAAGVGFGGQCTPPPWCAQSSHEKAIISSYASAIEPPM